MASGKAKSFRTLETGKLDPARMETLTAFRAAAKTYTETSTRTKAAAQSALKKQGVLTPTGRLTKKYAATS